MGNFYWEELLKNLVGLTSAFFYFDIGAEGTKIIDILSFDLKETFSEETGFSPRNLKYMRKFVEAGLILN
jgi:hypothetical protein